jgi:hypothetical protein
VTATHPGEAAAWRKLHDGVFSRPYSVGVRASLSWATALARGESTQFINARLLVRGVLLDGISYQSDAFASVQLVNYKVAPPLSVGLFGDWGSGKSFFMAKLRERVDQLAAAARAKPAAESWFCGQRGEVIQIEFNAWHYMDADLWSSLAVRVFDELSDRLKAEFTRACLDKLASLHDRAVELEAQRTALDDTRKQLDGEIETQEQLREQRVVEAREYAEIAERLIVRDIAADPEVQAASRQLRVEGEAIRSELVLAAADLQTIFGAAHRLWRTRRAPQQMAVALLYGAPVLVGALTWAYASAAGSLRRPAKCCRDMACSRYAYLRSRSCHAIVRRHPSTRRASTSASSARPWRSLPGRSRRRASRCRGSTPAPVVPDRRQ